MKPRTVAVLAILVAALAAFLWFVDRDLPSSEERTQEAKKILPIDPETVDAVTVQWDGHTVRMEKAAPPEDSEPPVVETWQIVDPLRARADEAQVNRLLEALGALERTRVIEDADPAAVGLETPRGQVTMELSGTDGKAGGERVLRVGSAVPTSDEVLVSVGSGDGPARTYVTSDSFVSQLQREPGEWRDKDVFTSARNAIERVTLSVASPGSAAKPVVLARRDDRFRIEQPLSDVADPDRVDALLSALVSLRVDRFLDGAEAADLPEKGLDPPRQTLQASLEGGETFRLDLGRAVPDQASGPDAGTGRPTVYAKVGDQVFTATTDLPSSLDLSPSAWRSPDWTSIESFQIERLDVTQGETSFTLRRDGVDWMRDADTIPYAKASGLLSAVTGAEGTVANEAAPETGLVSIKVTPQEGDPVTLTLYPAAPDGTHLAGSSERTALLRLSKETASGLLDAVAAVRDAEPVRSGDETPASDGAPSGS